MPWVQAATSITSGLDADKPAIPAIGDMYGATDTQKLYVCFTAGTWTKVSYLANSSSGTLANLPASPQVGDTYFVTDLNIQAACFTAGVWTNTTKRKKVGQFTRDLTLASGIQTVGGVGFKSSIVIFLYVRYDIDSAECGVGYDDGTGHTGIANNQDMVANTWAQLSTSSIDFRQGAGVTYDGKVTSFDDDGFSITWTKAGATAGNGRIYYLALES